MNWKKLNNKLYDKSSLFVGSTLALTILAIWAFFEASFWFVAPDFLILLFALVLPKRYKKLVFVAVIFSFLGGLFYYLLNLFWFPEMSNILFNTPYVASRNVEFVSNLFLNYGVIATLLQSITLIPFKIWTHFAVEYGLNSFTYFFLVMISRIFRLFLMGFISALVGVKLKKFVKNNFLGVLIAFFIVFFGVMGMLES